MPSKKRKGKKGNKGAAPKDPPPPAQALKAQDPDAPTKNQTKQRCPFFIYGICRYGDNCRNAHDQRSAGTNTEPPAVVKLTTTLCTRHRAQIQQPTTSPPRGPPPANWAEAPVFVPKSCWKSFAEALKSSLPEDKPPKELCPYFALFFQCPMDKSCPYVHGGRCDLCQMACLHPFDEGQRKRHLETCEKELVQDMEKSFAIQRSSDKVCGICHDVVWEKEKATDRRFGILERCNHVFCLSCIRTWRRMGKPDDPTANPPTPTEHMPTRMCPECRTHSNFFIPSKFWAEGEDKLQVIQEFKASLGKTKCMYFNSGKGRCPFGGMCFYLHATPDGTKVDLPPPPGNRWRRGADGEADIMEAIYLWDFMEMRVEDVHNV